MPSGELCSLSSSPEHADLSSPTDMTSLVAALKRRSTLPGTPVAQQRTSFESVVAAMPLPGSVNVSDVHLGEVAAERVASDAVNSQTILYLHGGGYVLGSSASGRPLAAQLAEATSAVVYSLDYRLAPEHPCPAAIDDSTAAYEWLLDQGIPPHQIAFVGDSAGGGLTMATLVKLRNHGLPMPAGAVCISPWVDLTLTASSLSSNADSDPQVSLQGLQEMAVHYLNGLNAASPVASPLFADLAGLPPILIQVGGAEALLDDAGAMDAALRAAGVDSTLEIWDGMIHVWHFFAPRLQEASLAVAGIANWLQQRWRIEPARVD